MTGFTGRTLDVAPLRLYSHDLAFFERYLEGLAEEGRDGHFEALLRFSLNVPGFAGMSPGEIRAAAPTVEDARLVYALEHGLESLAQLEDLARRVAGDPAVEPFADFIQKVEAGDMDGVRQCLQKTPELVNRVATTYKSPLHSTGSVERARLLLEQGADPELEVLLRGSTPLVHALIWGWDEVAELISQYSGATRNLRVAAGLGDIGRLSELVDAEGGLLEGAGADREYYRPNHGWYAWVPGDSSQEILDEGLIYAVCNGRQEAAAWLIERGAQIDGKVYETTALLRAAWRGRFDMVTWLVEDGASLDMTGWLGGHAQGVTAMHLAASQGHLDVVGYLIEQGADHTIADVLYQGTPEGWARNFNQDEVVSLLQQLS